MVLETSVSPSLDFLITFTVYVLVVLSLPVTVIVTVLLPTSNFSLPAISTLAPASAALAKTSTASISFSTIIVYDVLLASKSIV